MSEPTEQERMEAALDRVYFGSFEHEDRGRLANLITDHFKLKAEVTEATKYLDEEIVKAEGFAQAVQVWQFDKVKWDKLKAENERLRGWLKLIGAKTKTVGALAQPIVLIDVHRIVDEALRGEK